MYHSPCRGGSPRFDTYLAKHPLEYSVTGIAETLRDASRFVTRASQRIDGTSLVPEERSGHRLYVNESGELTWEKKGFDRPPRTIFFGSDVPPEGKVAITDRQKCPIGYTAKKGETIPLRKIYDGVFNYLDGAGLIDPVAFCAPKELSTTPG